MHFSYSLSLALANTCCRVFLDPSVFVSVKFDELHYCTSFFTHNKKNFYNKTNFQKPQKLKKTLRKSPASNV